MQFENGWAVTIAALPCQHIDVMIVPAWFYGNPPAAFQEFEKNKDYWDKSAMIERGDYIPHFTDNDVELLNLITDVKFRDQEPHLKKVSQDIMKAVKS